MRAMMRASGIAVASLLAVTVATGACKDKAPEYAGVGPWNVETTTLAKASGRCDPTDLVDGRKGMYCYLQPMLPIAEQAADVDLYFAGTAQDAPLAELQLKLKTCKPEATLAWLRTQFGAPTGIAATSTFFQNRFLTIAAVLPAPSGRCMIYMYPLREKALFERRRAQAGAAQGGDGAAGTGGGAGSAAP